MGTSGWTMQRLLLASAFALIASGLLSCGGSGGLLHGSQDAEVKVWPSHGWDGGVKAGNYTLVAVDSLEESIDPLTDNLVLRSETVAGGERLTAGVYELAATDHAYLHLKYDAEAVHPVLSEAAAGLSDRVVFLAITSQPGVVVLGLQGLHGEPVLSGTMDICVVEFATGPYTGERLAAAVSDTPVSDLAFDDTAEAQLEWNYTCPGDYNQDSLVTIADITPIGIHWQKNSTAADWAAAQVADGNHDTWVTINDLTPLGQNWGDGVTGYLIGAMEQARPVLRMFASPLAGLLLGVETYEMFKTFLVPLINGLISEWKQGRDSLFYNAPLALLFYTTPYADQADGMIAATYAMLAAEALGLGTCMIGSVPPVLQRSPRLLKKYGLPPKYKPVMVLIAGYPRYKFHSTLRRTFKDTRYI